MTPKRIYLCMLLILFLNTTLGLCNTDSRHWKLTSGETFHAELVKYDPVQDIAVLRNKEKQDKEYSLEDFSAIDAAWLLEWAKVSRDLDDMLMSLKGEFSHYQHEGKIRTADFYVYTPSKYKKRTTKLPMLILFSPSGKGARYVKRFMKAAEKLSIIIVSSDGFRNSKDVGDNDWNEMHEYFKEFLPALEQTVPHDPDNLYMGGSSGGALRAYHLSAMIDRPWAGIFANGGWLGTSEYYDLPYPAMRVAIVNGNNDKAANRWIKPDVAVLEKAGCAVNIFAFEGGHQVPPEKSQLEALEWLINGDIE